MTVYPENITLDVLTSDTEGSWVPVSGGEWVCHVVKTSGTGTASLQISPDGGTTAIDVSDSSGAITLTDSGSFSFTAGNKNQIRPKLASSGSTPSFSYYLSPAEPR